MGFEEDHEAIADIVYRSHSEHDRNRARPESIADMRLGGGSPVVASWRCRYPGAKSPAPPCRVMLDVDQEIVDRLAAFNAQLVSSGQDPIGTHEVMVCDAHKRLIADYERDKLPGLRMQRQLEMAEAIRELKNSNQPRQERALLDVLEKRRHPDVEALLATLEEKLGNGKKRRVL